MTRHSEYKNEFCVDRILFNSKRYLCFAISRLLSCLNDWSPWVLRESTRWTGMQIKRLTYFRINTVSIGRKFWKLQDIRQESHQWSDLRYQYVRQASLRRVTACFCHSTEPKLAVSSTCSISSRVTWLTASAVVNFHCLVPKNCPPILPPFTSSKWVRDFLPRVQLSALCSLTQ